MPYASVTYTATAGQTVFGPITFPGGAALQSSHIKVYVNGSLVSSTVTGSLSSPSVTIAATALGDNVRIERQTPTTASTRLVDFEDGDVLTASDLDTAMLNNLYVAQEANDVGAQGLPLDPVNNVWNAGSRRIVNVNTPSNATDAANKAYVDSVAFTPGTGTVTSVGLNFPADFNVGNSPITNSGTINVEWAKIDSGNKVFGASLSTGLPEFRLLTAGDIPSLTAAKITDFNTQVRTNRLDQMAVPTGSVSMNSQLITSVATCQNGTDAANKAYVDSKSAMSWDPHSITPTIVSSSTVQVECRISNSQNSRLNIVNWTSASGAFSGNSGTNYFRINNNTANTVTLMLLHSTAKWDLAGFNNCANPDIVATPWALADGAGTGGGGKITISANSFYYFKSTQPIGSEWGSPPYNDSANGVAGTRASWNLWFLRLT